MLYRRRRKSTRASDQRVRSVRISVAEALAAMKRNDEPTVENEALGFYLSTITIDGFPMRRVVESIDKREQLIIIPLEIALAVDTEQRTRYIDLLAHYARDQYEFRLSTLSGIWMSRK